MKLRTYNKEMANNIKNFFEKDAWQFRFDEEKGVFKFGVSLNNKLRNISFTILVRENNYSVYASSPISSDINDNEMMTRMAEFICRINNQTIFGAFQLDYTDGEIQFKVCVPCDDVQPSESVIMKSIYIPVKMFNHYGEGIVNIIFTNISATKAVEQCEGSDRTEIGKIITQMMKKFPDADVETLTARITEKLGIKSGSDESSNDINIKTDIFGDQEGDE